jgi:hypothetical protein
MHILTHTTFVGHYYITAIVDRHASQEGENISPYADIDNLPFAKKAYQLCDAKSGKFLKHLVAANRLKRCMDRTEFNIKQPIMDTGSQQVQGSPIPSAEDQSGTNSQSVEAPLPLINDQTTQPVVNQSGQSNQAAKTEQEQNEKSDWHLAKWIVRKRVVNNKLQFLVKFYDNSLLWCNDEDVGLYLKMKYFTKVANERRRRQKAERERFR